jgi:nitroimidazol reductase NimA-like FMN-containing flavoprotein (pyridoxamine 5'-phosphate oxidase superfamily)
MRPMRRKDREMPRDFAETVIDKCRFAVMATVNPDGTPYCVPLSVVRDGEWLYFHCAREGHKIDTLKYQNRVCVSCVGDMDLPPDHFTVAYESATVFGTAEEVTERDEKVHILRLLSIRYTPAHMAAFDEEIRKTLDATAVWKIHIDEASGKQRVHP